MKPLLHRKSIKICCNYGLAPLLFGWLAFSVGRQVAEQSQLGAAWLHIQRSFFTPNILLLIAAVLLAGLNWWLEACKWRLLVATLWPMGYRQSVASVLSGVSFAVSTPNRVGEYLGRLLYLPPALRMRGAALSFAGNISQLLVTLVAGWGGLLWLRQPLQSLVPETVVSLCLWLTALGCLLLLWLYGWGLQGAARVGKHLPASWQRHLPSVRLGGGLLLQLFGLSVLRYGVFVVQYLLVFCCFGVLVSPGTLALAMCVWFWAMAIIPTVALAEAGIRGKLSLVLVGLFSANNLGITLTALVVWLLNLVLPALAGSGLILRHLYRVPTNTNDATTDTPAVGVPALVDAGGST